MSITEIIHIKGVPFKLKRQPTCLICNEPLIKYETHKCPQRLNKPRYIHKSFFIRILQEMFFTQKRY